MSDTDEFIAKMTEHNLKRLNRLSGHSIETSPHFDPVALCNRKTVTESEQRQHQCQMYQALFAYVIKVKEFGLEV